MATWLTREQRWSVVEMAAQMRRMSLDVQGELLQMRALAEQAGNLDVKYLCDMLIEQIDGMGNQMVDLNYTTARLCFYAVEHYEVTTKERIR